MGPEINSLIDAQKGHSVHVNPPPMRLIGALNLKLIISWLLEPEAAVKALAFADLGIWFRLQSAISRKLVLNAKRVNIQVQIIADE